MINYLLSLLVFLPLVGAAVVLALPQKLEKQSKYVALAFGMANLLLSLFLYSEFDGNQTAFQFLEERPWFKLHLGQFGTIDVKYILGVDGLSMPMVLLAGIVLLVGSVSAWHTEKKAKAFFAFYLLLSSTIYGCFLALDFFLFFLFFELMLLPMYFLIGIWGGLRREYAAMKFIIYTLVGSVFILIVMLIMGLSMQSPFVQNTFTLDFRLLADPANIISGSVLDPQAGIVWLGHSARAILFLLLLVGFGIKLPTVPFHTWLPDAHVEAPTAISVVLAGILLKVGGYGFFRIAMGFFPEQAVHYSNWIAVFGVVSILYGAFNALAQSDLKKLIAYSSVSHMGFVLLGVAALNEEGLNGAIFQMFSHGILSSMLFLCVGIIYDRTGNRLIENYRGLATQMPWFTGAVLIAFFGSLGLPGLSGFIGEFFSLMGAFGSKHIPQYFAVLAVLGIVLSAVYLLWAMQRMFFGEFWVNRGLESSMTELSLRESFLLYGLGILAILFGVCPGLIFSVSNATVADFLQNLPLK